MLRLLLFTILVGTISSKPLNILVYNPVFGHSHSNFLNKVSDALIDAGHNVIQFSPFTDPAVKRGTTKAHVISMDADVEGARMFAKMGHQNFKDTWTTLDGSPFEMMKLFKAMISATHITCEGRIENEELLEKLKSYNFDIALSEPYDACGFGIFELIGVPRHISVFSTSLIDGIARWYRVPTAPSYVPTMNSVANSYMSFRERFSNALSTLFEDHIYDYMIQGTTDVFRKKFGDQFPDVKTIVQKSIYIFTNSDPLFDFSHPTLQKVIEIGGISVPPKQEKKLEEHWDRLLSLRPSTVLVSFGSMAQSHQMPDNYKQNLIKTFKRFPTVTFLWKYEVDDSSIGVSPQKATGNGTNVVISPWVPQTDLLGDNRVIAFVTHGGLGSVNEAIHRGVPTITVPLFGDQFRNAKMMEQAKTSIFLEKTNLADEQKLYGALKAIIEEEELRSSAHRLSSTIANRPFSPAELLVKFTEFAAYHGPFPHLDTPAKDMGFIQYFLIDIIATVSVVTLFIVFIVFKFLAMIIRFVSSLVKKSPRKVKMN